MSIAFFDVDGTLLPHPSLEIRFFWRLLRTGKIPVANCLGWTAETANLCTRTLVAAAQSNKTYLRGLSPDILIEWSSPEGVRWVPELFPSAVQRIWWHALRGDAIALATGTLSHLAHIVKAALERELLWRGIETRIAVIATELVSRDGSWTGDVQGLPTFGE